VLVVDGRVAGTWDPAVDGAVATITVTPVAKLPRGALAAARRSAETVYAGVLANEVQVVVGARR
jgi:hypothetical protein